MGRRERETTGRRAVDGTSARGAREERGTGTTTRGRGEGSVNARSVGPTRGWWSRSRARGLASTSTSGSGSRSRATKTATAGTKRGRDARRNRARRGPVRSVASRGDGGEMSRQEMAGRRLASGTLATVVVRTILAPLERVKIEYLLNRSTLKLEEMVRGIVVKEGFGGFWKGNGLNIARTAPFKAINFCAFDTYREFVVRTLPEGDARRIGLVCAGAGAGMTAVVTCFPMDVLRTRLLTNGGQEKYGSFWACVKTMYRQEGMSTFYRGITPALVSMVPNAAVYYSVYDGLKNRRLAQLNAEREAASGKRRRGKGADADASDSAVKTIEQKNMMLYGAVAGVASEASTYPFEVVRRRMQMQGGRSSTSIVFGRKALMSMANTLRSTARETGVRSLYAGLGPSCVQVLPSAALGYYTYEMFKLLLEVD